MSALSMPAKTLLMGGACYGAGVLYMTTRYYDSCLLKKIFVRSDKIYEKVKVGHHAGVPPPSQ